MGVILGLKHTRTGDTLVSVYKSLSSTSLPNIISPPPVMSASIIPQSHSDLDPVQDALQSLVRTDPSVRADTQDGQTLIHGLGALHLEIVEGRLRHEWGVRFQVGKRRVSYREGFRDCEFSTTYDAYTQDIAGKPVVAIVQLKLRKVLEDEHGDPIWDGNIVVDAGGRPLLHPDAYVPTDPEGQVARGISSVLSNSPHTSLPISNVYIQVQKFQYPSSEASASILATASAAILRSILREAGMGPVMEPYVRMKISVPEDSLGSVVKDLTETGGEILSMASDNLDGINSFPDSEVYIPPHWLSPSSTSVSKGLSSPRLKQTINALAPLSRILDYSTRLRALSCGHGVFEMVNAGFKEVSVTRMHEILQEVGRM